MITERMTAILNSVSQRVEKLVPSGRFYVVLYDSKKKELSFPLVRDSNKNLSTWDSRPWKLNNVLPDLVIANAKSLLYESDLLSHLEKGEIHYWPDEKNAPRSWLGVPLVAGEQVLGALVVESWQKTYSFNKNDEATLATVARQAAITIENIRLLEQLARRADNLKVLNDVGRQLASGLEKQEKEILDLTHDGIARLRLDTRDMYIALYDPDPDRPDTAEEIYGMLHFALEFKGGEQTSTKSRLAKNGLAEVVIRTKHSFNPSDVQKTHVELGQTHTRPIPRSWMGVPMISEGQVFGVIVLRNYELPESYTADDQEILEILAGQVATSLQNLKLYNAQIQIQEQRMAAESIAIMGNVAAEFAHKMNNLAGTIPVRIAMAKSQLNDNNPKDAKIIEHLTKIENEANSILAAAKEIRESSDLRAPEEINVHQLLEIAIEKAKNTQQNIQNSVEIRRIFIEDLPFIQAERNSFLDTLTSIIKNGIEAIDTQGIVTIKTRRTQRAEKKYVEIEISDTGRGIPSSDLSKVFDLFYTTKGGKGLGFGLWRDRTFIKRLGGEIDVQSELGKGSIFTIRIPSKGEK